MKRKNENLSTQQIIELALNEKDEDARWNLVGILHRRGNEEVFKVAVNLCESSIPKQITLGADILGQLGTPEFPFKNDSLALLLKIVDEVEDIDALQSITIALGRMEDEKAIAKLLELKNHENEDIRSAVVYGLLTVNQDEAIKALIELSADTDEDVRNWATFGLGSQIETDTKEIRDALFQRLNEKDHEIRGEALVGLAIRKDERVIIPLLKELSRKSISVLSVEAAAEIGDERLCESLLKIEDWWDVNKELLETAIKNCCENKADIVKEQ